MTVDHICRRILESSTELKYSDLNMVIGSCISLMAQHRGSKLAWDFLQYIPRENFIYFNTLWYHPEESIFIHSVVKKYYQREAIGDAEKSDRRNLSNGASLENYYR